ncbi:transcription factor ILR3-like [Ipomoea triloba]|uniref:transcription factor ILR3-like n=1 Tax=Ipomoea triloba TaxID=35885 RepID=UPI00125E1260|nr:transcription factor ILR3-like [Ipomoea triloba]GLL45724.1 transcription factor ILR3-like [Ipomoea trifida]GMD91811.1 transcription factor ILR3-like [Ipomoea batatas]GME13677.1 transcription factor ILR3-like [Ipomoea batatas]GME15100.1 transcription factor ILR3-like [Ipomoea batatas]
MAAPEEDCSNWLLDLGFEDISVPGAHFPSLEPGFQWPPNAFSVPAAPSTGLDVSDGNSDVLKECNSKKRARSEACNAPESKAHREKMRRDRLNDRFQELSSVLDPGKPPKMDKSAILSDAVRMVVQLRDEAQKLKKSFDNLQEKVNELKAEKNELRDEKQKLKTEKDKLEQQLKALNSQPGFLPHPPAIPAPFAAPHQVVGSKLVPFVGYPGIPMWQFAPAAAVDTSEDHALRPPVA